MFIIPDGARRVATKTRTSIRISGDDPKYLSPKQSRDSLALMTHSEPEPQPGGLPPIFEASPVVTVDFGVGQRLSITHAKRWADEVNAYVLKLLLPADDWYWWSDDAFAGMFFLFSSGSGIIVSREQARTKQQSDIEQFITSSRGFVAQSKDKSRYDCRVQWNGESLPCGITNDLNDAKYLVAEAVREQLAAAAVGAGWNVPSVVTST